jgi:hypothetical protein
MENNYVAGDIYERLEMNEQGATGDVMSDLSDILDSNDFQAFEDYFGDTDPFEYL